MTTQHSANFRKTLKMNDAQNHKTVGMIFPLAIADNTHWAATEVDSLGFDYAQIYVMLGATDIAMAALKVTESDSAGSGHTDVSGLDYDGDTDIDGNTQTLPTADNDNTLFCFDIDLKTRKRYLDLVITAGDGSTGTYAAAWCVLSRAAQSPKTATARGLDSVLRV